MSTQDWTHRDDVTLAKYWCIDHKPVREIAFRMGTTKSSVYRRIQALDLKGKQGDIEEFEHRYGSGVNFPVSRVEVEYEPRGTIPDREVEVSIHWGDVHFPFQDDAALEILYQITEDLQPDTLVCHGDVYDFWQLSSHRPPNEKNLSAWQIDLQGTMDASAHHLGRMSAICSEDTRKVFLGGNHEDRWDRCLGNLKDDRKIQHITSLNKFEHTFNFEYVSGIEDDGWEYYPYTDGGDPFILHNQLVCIHGNHVTLWVTRKVLEMYGKSVMLGHTHRFQNWTQRTLKGQEAGFNIGCMCDINPHYMPMANWHQGFAVVDWSADGLFDVQFVRIHEGKTVFRGREYSA